MALILGTDWDDDLDGFGGDDEIYGYDGDDLIFGDWGNDGLFGGWDNDELYGEEDDDDLFGDSGQDDLYGGSGADYLNGGSGSDWLFGGSGSDLLEGRSGSDRLEGGTGIDTAIYELAYNGVTVNLSTGTASGDGSDTLRDIEGVVGSDYSDIITGNSVANTLEGLDGNDRLDGRGGRDSLFGDAGQDRLTGGTGQDYLKGGTGADTFVFSAGTSGITATTADLIADWSGGSDRIDMPVKGTSANYEEAATSATTVGAAVDAAEAGFTDRYVFLHNSGTDTGYLVSDLNADGDYDTCVVLKNAGFAADFSYTNII